MQADPPPAPYSNDLNSGPRSSQFDKRIAGKVLVAVLEKSGSRNGLDFRRDFTEAGRTCFSASSGGRMTAGLGASVVMMRSSGLTSVPDSTNQSRRIFCATGLVAWSTSSREMSEVSRAAVLARMVATPSRRLSCSAREASFSSGSVLTRARSSRTRKAMT